MENFAKFREPIREILQLTAEKSSKFCGSQRPPIHE